MSFGVKIKSAVYEAVKTIRRVTVNKDGRPRWKESSTRDRVHRVSIRR